LDVEVKNAHDLELAEVLVQLRGSLDREDVEHLLKVAIINVLEITTPEWRENGPLLDRLRELGAANAAKNLLDRYGL
jgi:hypothetical protein